MAVFREEQIENGAKRLGIGIGDRVIYIGISALRIANNQSSLFPLLSVSLRGFLLLNYNKHSSQSAGKRS